MKKDEVINRLKNAQYKITATRESIIDVLVSQDKYLSAEDILKHIKMKKSINISTIYRNIEILKKLNLIEIVALKDDKQSYKLKDKIHSHNMICTSCGIAKKIEFCPYSLLKEHTKDFHIMDHKFEIYGICSKCKKKG